MNMLTEMIDNDCISRRDAIDAIEREKIAHGRYTTSSYVGYEFAEKVIRQLQSVQPESNWIPVTERLPEIGKEVILSYYDTTTIGWLLEDGNWIIYEGDANADANDIFAWMPLPEQYGEVAE